MNKKNIKVDFEYDYDFLLVGICTPLKEYTLSYLHGIFTEEPKLNLLKKIKNLERIVSAHFITIAELKSKENLII